MLGEYGIYGQIRAILTAMFNSLMPSLNSRSVPFVVFLGGFPSRCQNLSSGAIRPGGLLFAHQENAVCLSYAPHSSLMLLGTGLDCTVIWCYMDSKKNIPNF